jgi:hypothetical protein
VPLEDEQSIEVGMLDVRERWEGVLFIHLADSLILFLESDRPIISE